MRLTIPSILLLALGACVRRVPETPSQDDAARLLVLPPEVESTTDLTGVDLERTIADAFAAGNELVVVRSAHALEPGCSERIACLREVGRVNEVALVVVSTVVTLGDTAIVRMRLLPVDEGGTEQVRQTVVSPADAGALDASLAAMARDLASPFAVAADDGRARRRRRFRWLGPLLGVAAAGASATTAVVVRRREPEPDVVITPP